jgi:hypothetical protein
MKVVVGTNCLKAASESVTQRYADSGLSFAQALDNSI